jgi:hypothetical protein
VKNAWVMTAIIVGAAGATAIAQTSKVTAAQRDSRYQVGVMERVLEGAVEHGVTKTRDRLQAALPAEMEFVSESARVRGFRLEGYGLFFDVIVPSFQGTMPWVLRTLDQNALGLDSALKALRAHIETAKDANLEQALKRVELQVGPLPQARTATPVSGARTAPGSAAVAAPDQSPSVDPILSDPNEAFRAEVKQALMDAMLDHSNSLRLGPSESLTVAARRSNDRPQLSPADSEAATMVIRVSGADLSAFLAREITREEALKRIEVRVF